MSELLLDAAGRRRSPATLPEFHAGRPPRNNGIRYPADPPTIQEIVAVMRRAGDTIHGRRLRGLLVVLWRAGLRIHEALALAEADLDPRRGSLLVRRGKGGRRREVGMDDWAWEQLARGSTRGSSCRSARCSASSTARRAGGRGLPAPPAGTAPHRPRGRPATAVRATPAAPRARRRDGARGRAADRHPTPARSYQPRHYLDLPPRHRQRRDHRHRPRPPPPDDPRRQIAAELTPRPAAGKPRLASRRSSPIASQRPGERFAECSIHRKGAARGAWAALPDVARSTSSGASSRSQTGGRLPMQGLSSATGPALVSLPASTMLLAFRPGRLSRRRLPANSARARRSWDLVSSCALVALPRGARHQLPVIDAARGPRLSVCGRSRCRWCSPQAR